MTSVLSLFYLLVYRVRHVTQGCHHPCSPGNEISFLYLGLTRSKTGNTSCGASHCFVMRSQVCPRTSQSNESWPCFQSAVPGGLELSWGFGSLCASKILSDKFIEIGLSVFHELSDFYVRQFLPFRAFPDRERLFSHSKIGSSLTTTEKLGAHIGSSRRSFLCH